MRVAAPVILVLFFLAAPLHAEPPALEYEERLTAGATADEVLPMIVAIHGMGDRPENFASLLEDLPFKARVILPRAPSTYSRGYSWYVVRWKAKTPESRADSILAGLDQLVGFVSELRRTKPTRGKPVVLGFSQGGVLSFQAALRYPDVFALAMPLAGRIPRALFPETPCLTSPPIRALHGRDDHLFPVPDTEAAVAQLRSLGCDVTLQIYDGVKHKLNHVMKAEIYRLLRDALVAPPVAPKAPG